MTNNINETLDRAYGPELCGGARTLSLRGVDGDSGLARAETCGECPPGRNTIGEASILTHQPRSAPGSRHHPSE